MTKIVAVSDYEFITDKNQGIKGLDILIEELQ